jgi:[ribosomal protein S5]-alanine N-acetyltransferase
MSERPDPAAPILTARLALAPLTIPFFEASLARDRARAAALLGAAVPDDWFDDDGIMGVRLGDLRGDPSLLPWLMRAMVRRDDGVMVGHCGFHGRPGAAYLEPYAPGGAEMGYTVFPAYRRQSYATEAVAGLMGWAAAQGVPAFVLSIAPANVPSQAIARRLGFVKVGSHMDPEDGLEEIFARPAP